MEEKLRKRLEEIQKLSDSLKDKLYLSNNNEYEQILNKIRSLSLEQYEIYEKLEYLEREVAIDDGEIELVTCENSSICFKKYDIYLCNKNKKIGYIEFRDGNLPFIGNIGYGISEEYTRHGYATRAFRLLNDILNSLGIESVIVTAYKDNLASIRVIEKVGGELIDFDDKIVSYRCCTDNKKKVK